MQIKTFANFRLVRSLCFQAACKDCQGEYQGSCKKGRGAGPADLDLQISAVQNESGRITQT